MSRGAEPSLAMMATEDGDLYDAHQSLTGLIVAAIHRTVISNTSFAVACSIAPTSLDDGLKSKLSNFDQTRESRTG
jgi:hypothetical protein